MPTDLASYRYMIRHDGDGTWIAFPPSRLTGHHRIVDFRDEPGKQVAITDSGLRIEFPYDCLMPEGFGDTSPENLWQFGRHVSVVDAPALIAWLATPDPQ